MRAMLYAGWTLCFGLGSLCLGLFVQGVIRDQRVGDPELPLSLARRSEWIRQPFRVWKSGPHQLHLSTVNHEPPFHVPYRGGFEVRILDPRGREAFHRVYAPGSLEHERPQNLSWSRLDSLELADVPWRRWTLAARVVEADPGFAGASSTLMLRRAQREVGMGGLINYVMIFPAMLFLPLALWAGVQISRGGGSNVPLWLAGAGCAVLLLLLSGRMHA